jgi:Domain of unknown function (DUF4349)
MSQRDLAAELRAARITAPVEVRERIRAIAATDTTARGPRFTPQFTWRRALVLAVPVAAAVAATIVFTRPTDHPTAVPEAKLAAQPAIVHGAATQTQRGGPVDSATTGARATAIPVAPSPTRVQRYGATLTLRVPTPDGVSAGVQRALRIATALGGHPTSVHATSHGRTAQAELVLRIPRRNVQRAVTRLSQLGTITGEQVDVQDLQAGLDTTSRTITRLQTKLESLRTETQTPDVVRQIAALTAQVASLQRAQANTVRGASFATVRLTLATPPVKAAVQHHHRSPFHWLWRALLWLGVGAVYTLVLGIPVALLALIAALVVRTVRRRREDALLSRT